jgi:hypothetical protein
MDIDINTDKHKFALILASSYITGFEILQNAIVEHLHGIFFDKVEYQKAVLKLDKKKFDASCEWYFKNKIVTENELKRLKEIRDYRNTLTHELINIMFSAKEKINLRKLEELNFFIKKIDLFWGKMEGLNPEKDDFKSGRMLVMDYLIEIATELNRKNYK